MYSFNATSVQIAADRIVAEHKNLKNAKLSDEKCKKNFSDTVCKVALIACSHDRTKLVALLSKQECYKNLEW